MLFNNRRNNVQKQNYLLERTKRIGLFLLIENKGSFFKYKVTLLKSIEVETDQAYTEKSIFFSIESRVLMVNQVHRSKKDIRS